MIRHKILIVAATPKNLPRLRLDQEVREVENGLRLSKKHEEFEIETRFAVRSSDLRQALLEIKPEIVHFCGHGETEGLFLENMLAMLNLFLKMQLQIFLIFVKSIFAACCLMRVILKYRQKRSQSISNM